MTTSWGLATLEHVFSLYWLDCFYVYLLSPVDFILLRTNLMQVVTQNAPKLNTFPILFDELLYF